MNLLFAVYLLCFSLNFCNASEEVFFDDQEKTTQIALITLPKLPVDLDAHFFTRSKSQDTPSFDDFFRKAFLVRACYLNLLADWNAVITTSRDRPCSYWTFGGVVPVDYMFKDSNAFVITPLAKRWGNIISISCPEVMVAGEVPLGRGDILVLNKGIFNHLYVDKRFHENCKRKGFTVTFYSGGGYYDEKDLKEPRRIVHTLLREQGAWIAEMPLGFWTPATPVKVDGKSVHPMKFFENFLRETPASFGSEYYSIRGSASFLSGASEILLTDLRTVHYPSYFKALKELLKGELKEYFGQFKDFDESARIAVNEFLNTKSSSSLMATLLVMSQKFEKDAYKGSDFITDTVRTLITLPDKTYRNLKEKTPFVPERQVLICDAIFGFSKWAEKFSPDLAFPDQLPTAIDLPDSINRSILKQLSLAVKITIFQHLFQLHHDRGLIYVDQVIEMFDDPVGFFRGLNETLHGPV